MQISICGQQNILKGKREKKEYTGFLDYIKYGKITDAFIEDFQYWCRRYFSKWNLFVEFDEFYSICWTALLEKLPEFDPVIATIQTFVLSRIIKNEVFRLWEKNKGMLRKHEEDSDDPVVMGSVGTTQNNESFELLYSIELLGIQLNVKELDYLPDDSLPKKCLVWFRMKSNL